jgi:hypothetical protein
VKQVHLTHGFVALVDDEDFERVNAHAWSVMNHGAAQARIGKARVQMHRFILDLTQDDKRIVDHINHNRLDNRRCNLRIVTHAENCANRVPHKGRPFKGVIDNRRGKPVLLDGPWARSRTPKKRYRAQIVADGVLYNLGSYPTEEEAARAYDRKAIELHGEYALLNFPNEQRAESVTA